jgi:enamine deaminase RidA (YjgF/YER057c/UK114 family)
VAENEVTDLDIDARLSSLGLVLPEAAVPVAAYVPTLLVGHLLHISGQLSMRDGELVKGRLGDQMNLEDGAAAARASGLMVLAQIKSALGSLARVEQVVKLGVFVSSTPDFVDQPKVANGASELFLALFGDAGRHARSAVGVTSLPLGAAVEIDAVVAVRPLNL